MTASARKSLRRSQQQYRRGWVRICEHAPELKDMTARRTAIVRMTTYLKALGYKRRRFDDVHDWRLVLVWYWASRYAALPAAPLLTVRRKVIGPLCR